MSQFLFTEIIKEKKINVLFTLIAIIVCAAVHAQGGNQGYFLKAEQLLNQQKYYEAAQYYEKYLVSEKHIAAKADPFAVGKKIKGQNGLDVHKEAIYHLAESYRLGSDFTRAEKYYKEASGFPEKSYPGGLYWYGVVLRSNQKYSEAIEAITSFREKHTQIDQWSIAADKEMENLLFIKQQLEKNKPGFFVTPVPTPSTNSAYAPVVRQGDTIVFTAVETDKRIDSSKKKPVASTVYFARLYESIQHDGALDNTHIIASDPQTGFHDGMAAFAGNKKMFFTRWTNVNGKPVSAIFSSDKTDAGWSTPLKMEEPVNMQGSNSTEPFVTGDGKFLLFSSDREGSIGKYDIWYAELDSNLNVLRVSNVGNVVNTIDDEFAPSYHQGSRTLLFSSNGRTGMGGLDIYYTRGSFIVSDWNKPANAGSPINSSKDDLYYVSTDEDNIWNTGIMSSDRDTTSCCLAMYSVRQDNKQYITGSVVDCATQQPLSNVSLSIKDLKNNKLLRAIQTDASGNYAFEMNNTSRYGIYAEKKGYDSASKKYTLHFEEGSDNMHNEVMCMSFIPGSHEDSLQQVLDALSNSSSTLAKFGYNKSTIGGTFSQLDSLAGIMQQFPSIVVEIGGYTDTKGTEEYNLALAQKRVNACIKYLVKKGISVQRLTGKAYGECCPIEPETIDGQDNPAAREKNRRVEYKLLSR
ncbi:MAG: OmpA family protein [Agriterribacter sp.]